MTQYEAAYKMPEAAANAPQLGPRNYRHFEITPLSGALGAEVIGLDLATLSEDGLSELEQALADHQVLAIRGQNLTPATQTEFAQRLGPLMRYDFVEPVAGHPFVTEIRSEPEDIFNFGGGCHSDSMNYECPPKLTMLYCRECPPVGGDTAFSNLYLAWESLSPGLQRLLAPMRQITATSLSPPRGLRID